MLDFAKLRCHICNYRSFNNSYIGSPYIEISCTADNYHYKIFTFNNEIYSIRMSDVYTTAYKWDFNWFISFNKNNIYYENNGVIVADYSSMFSESILGNYIKIIDNKIDISRLKKKAAHLKALL